MHDRRRKYSQIIRWVELFPGRDVVTFRDYKLRLILPFTDYLIYVAGRELDGSPSEQAYRSATEAVIYTLKNFAEFLGEKCIPWNIVGDALLKEYRDWAFSKIRDGGRSKSDRTAKRTVNVRMKIAYRFYEWAQEVACLHPNLIGWTDCQIRSSLILLRKSANAAEEIDRSMYPVCYRGIGMKSRTSDSQYWATADDIHDIEDYLRKSRLPDLAQRDVTLLRIVEYMGWRRGSVNSLTVDLFSEKKVADAIKRNLGTFPVEPPVQKLNRGFTFGVPFALVTMVRDYANGARIRLIGQRPDVSDGALFISARTGKPLSDSSISAIFNSAFQAIGAQKDAGLRSIRRKFAEDIHQAEIEFRKREGYSLAREDVAFATAPKMGHASPASIDAYNRALNHMQRASIEEKQRELLSAKDSEIMALKTLIASMETLINKNQQADAT